MITAGSARRKPGEIRDTIVDVLAEWGREASVAEIREAVAARLKGELSASSVRSYLRLNTPETFDRVAEGTYRLRASSTAISSDVPVATVRFDPVFTFGRSKLFSADCMEWLKAREAESIHAIVTDPPYGLVEYTATQQQKLRAGRGGVWRIPPSFDGHRRSPLPRFTVLEESDRVKLKLFFVNWAKACWRVLVPGAHVLIATNPLLSYLVASSISEAGFERRGEIIRLVMTMRGGDRPKNAHEEFPGVSVMPRSMYEPWLLFRKPFAGRVQDALRKWKTGQNAGLLLIPVLSPKHSFGRSCGRYFRWAKALYSTPSPAPDRRSLRQKR
jgi:hypothetical protein